MASSPGAAPSNATIAVPGNARASAVAGRQRIAKTSATAAATPKAACHHPTRAASRRDPRGSIGAAALRPSAMIRSTMSSRTGRGSSASASIPATSACSIPSRRHSSHSPCAASSCSSRAASPASRPSRAWAARSSSISEWSRIIGCLPEVRAQPAHREQRAGLHGPEREPGPLGDLRLREPLEIHPLDHLALLVRERTERGAHELALPWKIDRREEVVDRILHEPGPHLRCLFGTAPLRLLPSYRIHGSVMDRSHEPGPDRPASPVVAIRVPPHGEERLLDDLLRNLRLSDQSEREGVRGGRVTAEELAERLFVAGDETTEEILATGSARLNRAHGHARAGVDRHRCVRGARLSGDPPEDPPEDQMVSRGIRRSSALG